MFYKKKCKWCGKEFETQRENGDFCSRSCSAKFNAERRHSYDKVCTICGKKFIGLPQSKYCSNPCAIKGGSIRKTKMNEANKAKMRAKKNRNIDKFTKEAAKSGLSYGKMYAKETQSEFDKDLRKRYENFKRYMNSPVDAYGREIEI